MELSDKELLNFAIENGIIDVSDIQQKIEMNERNRYIENHNYSIWQSKDGKFYTYLPDEKYSRGKRLIKRTTEQALNDAIENDTLYDGYYWTWSNNYIVPPVLDDLYPVEEKRKARDFTIKGELSKWIRERESSPAFRLLC